MKNKKTFYITTPIYYPSGELHIGHLYSTSIAWVLKNYKKQIQNYETLFLTGADEHGQKIFEKAQENNLTPLEYVNLMDVKFRKLWSDFGIDFDLYSRTTSQEHEQKVLKIFEKLLEQKDIYKGEYSGLYSVSDEEFFTKTQARKEGNEYFHPVSGHKLEDVSEETYFFKFDKYQQWIQNLLEENKDNFIFPQKIVNEILTNFIKPGLEDLSLTRTNVEWGIRLKDDPKHTIYVWLDALTNYINILDENQFEKFWQNGDEVVHVLGKEITRFHCIYWPIFLKALNLRQPNHILAHGWLMAEDGKMSKSKGNVINPYDLLKNFDPEEIKYFLVSQIHFGQDGTFSEELLKTVYNANLANNFGNLVSRTLTLVEKNFPNGLENNQENQNDIYQKIISYTQEFENYFAEFKIDKALNVSMQLSRDLNGYLEESTPWKIEDKKQINQILINILNGIYAIGSMMQIVMPNKMNTLAKELSFENFDYANIQDFQKFDHKILKKSKPLFERKK